MNTLLTLEQCKNLTTPRLQAYYNKRVVNYPRSFLCDCCDEFIEYEEGDKQAFENAKNYKAAVLAELQSRKGFVRLKKVRRRKDNVAYKDSKMRSYYTVVINHVSHELASNEAYHSTIVSLSKIEGTPTVTWADGKRYGKLEKHKAVKLKSQLTRFTVV